MNFGEIEFASQIWESFSAAGNRRAVWSYNCNVPHYLWKQRRCTHPAAKRLVSTHGGTFSECGFVSEDRFLGWDLCLWSWLKQEYSKVPIPSVCDWLTDGRTASSMWDWQHICQTDTTHKRFCGSTRWFHVMLSVPSYRWMAPLWQILAAVIHLDAIQAICTLAMKTLKTDMMRADLYRSFRHT